MNVSTRAHRGARRGSLGLIAGLLLAAVCTVSESVAPAQAATDTLTVQVVSARTEPLAFDGAGVTAGDPIADFEYIVNEDNTGTTEQRSPADGCSPADADYPASCNWTSIAGAATSSPIVTQGDQSDFGAGVVLPEGRYLISVLADGFKLDGAHFTVPLDGPVTVELQPAPLPDSTIQAAVFEDISIVNGAPDLPAEHGLAGFQGHIKDYLGEVSTDVYGDPLCGDGICLSQCYVVDNGVDIGTVDPIDAAGRCPTDPTGLTMNEGGAVPATAAIEGKLIIPNLGTDRYALSITPPDGSAWTQTTTLEGNHDWDSWVMEGATGLDTEFVLAGEPFPAVFFGYVQPTGPLVGRPGRPRQRRGRGCQGVRARCRRGVRRVRPHRRQGRQADPQPVGRAQRPEQWRYGGVHRSRRRQRRLRHRQRARWHLHDDVVGRAAELHPAGPEHHGHRRRGPRRRSAAEPRMVDAVRGLRVQRHQPQRGDGLERPRPRWVPRRR